MIKRVSEFIIRYSMFAPGDKIGAAVSGGADSVALLHVLVELAPRWDLSLTVLHLDHRLRGEESRLDAQFVSDLARCLALPAEIREADVEREARQNGENLEQAARVARQEFFHGLLDSGQLDRVALGHTRSDQAETVLFRFLRGSGTAGLAGIRPVTSDGFVRPLLGVDRSEVEQFLRSRGIAWREDSSNRDTRFRRNRIRHDLLPELTREWNPSLPETLAHMATLAQDEEDYWESEIDRLAAQLLRVEPAAVLFQVDRLLDLPVAAGRRLLRRAIREVRGDLRQIDFSHIEQILALASSPDGGGRIQLPGVEALRSFEWIRLAPLAAADPASGEYRMPLSVPGCFPVPGTRSTICLELFEAPGKPREPYSAEKSGYNTERGSELDWGRIPGSLELRNWRPGDQFRPAGHAAEEKMKVLFQKARIPSWDRRSWPIITSGDTIIWTRQFGVAEGYASTPDSPQVLRVWETE